MAFLVGRGLERLRSFLVKLVSSVERNVKFESSLNFQGIGSLEYSIYPRPEVSDSFVKYGTITLVMFRWS